MTSKRKLFTVIQTQQAARILRRTQERLHLTALAASQASSDLVALENILRVAVRADSADRIETLGREIRMLSHNLLSADPTLHAKAPENYRRVTQGLGSLGIEAQSP